MKTGTCKVFFCNFCNFLHFLRFTPKIHNSQFPQKNHHLQFPHYPLYTPPMTHTPHPIIEEPLGSAISSRYLSYALSTIMHRALPDARDGLKPVHRRILYAMGELRLTATGGFRKSAKVSGDVMGNYHPHGDQAIYDALARLAQDFNLRYPLIHGQGNFGNIDGDNPAAARYTEVRLSKIGEAMMNGLEHDAVDFRDNYDGSRTEPVVMPAPFPNLLANGASGIAVGMATNIPPHNLNELCAAAIHMVDHPNLRDETLLEYIKGPDFPTGGVLVEPREVIAAAYQTGRGSLRLRAKWAVENLGHGQWQIVVTEIPYQVQKSRLIEKLADLIQTRKIPIFGDVRDESSEDVRLILEPKSKSVSPDILMEALFQNSDLEIRFAMNMNVLIDGMTPRLCSLKTILQAFLDHQREVLLRKSAHRLGKIDTRLEVLEGYIVAFLNLDRVIEIIRTCDEPKPVLCDEFVLNDTQAEAILNMRLRSLRKLEEMALRQELDDLQIERAGLEDLIAQKGLQDKTIKTGLREFVRTHGDARRTVLEEAPVLDDIPFDAMIERAPLTVICSELGWIRTMKGHIDTSQDLKYKDGDAGRFCFSAQTTDKLLAFGSNGRFYTLGCADLPGGRGMGEPLRLMVDLPNDVGLVALFVYDETAQVLVGSYAGDGFIVAQKDVFAQTRSGRQVLNVREGGAVACKVLSSAMDSVAVVGENRKLLVFPLAELPLMARGKGVRLQKYKDGGLADVTGFVLADGLRWLDPAGRNRVEVDLAGWSGKRAGAGRLAPRGFPQDGKFNC